MIIKLGGTTTVILPVKDIDYYSENKIPKPNNIDRRMLRQQINLCNGILMPGGNRIYEYDIYI